MPLLRSCLPTFTCLWSDRLYVGLEEDENNIPCNGPNGWLEKRKICLYHKPRRNYSPKTFLAKIGF